MTTAFLNYITIYYLSTKKRFKLINNNIEMEIFLSVKTWFSVML